MPPRFFGAMTMNISNRLTALAADINTTLDRHEKNRAEWVDIKLDLCRQLAEARAQFPDDQGFGRWFADTIGGAISRDDRAAYIAMGEHLDVARDVLEKTERSSIRHIHINEFAPRFRHVAKPAQQSLKPKPPQMEVRDEDIVAMWDRGDSVASIVVEKGLGERRVSRIIQDEKLKREGAAAAAVVAAPVSASAQQKLDARMRQLEKEFDQRVYTAALKMQEEWGRDGLTMWENKLNEYEKKLEWRSGVMTAKEYKTLMMCVHPDTAPNVSSDKRNEAVRILTEYRLKLMAEKEDPQIDRHGMPRTVEELLKRKAAVKAERAAQRQKSKEQRA
jgi:hypothetical protein